MNDAAEPLLRLQAVSKIFQTEEFDTYALSDVDLEIHAGEFVSVSGPSGCGKSTLLSILGLLDSPSAGTYRLDQRRVESLSPAERARVRREQIGFIFQSFNLIGDLSVYDNVDLPLSYRAVSKRDRRSWVEAALARVGMSHRARHLPHQLSGGQQQRVAVARAVVGDPLILLADEPTGNLDSTHGEQVMELLAELHRGGSTLCMVTHDPRYTRHAQRNLQLFDGRLLEESG